VVLRHVVLLALLSDLQGGISCYILLGERIWETREGMRKGRRD